MSAKKSNIANTIIVIVIFVGAFLSNIINPKDTVAVYVEEDILVIEGVEDVSYRVPLDTIDSFTYVEEMQYPEDSKSIICGTYTNEQWGEYTLCVNGKVAACVVAEAENGTYMFNYEDASTTKSLCQALQELL